MTAPKREWRVTPLLTAAISSFGRVCAALLLSSIITILLIAAIGGDVRLSLGALWDGAFGSPYNIGNTLVASTPLLLTGLGVGIAFQCRIWNIGGEGQFLVGALAASALALNVGAFSHLPSLLLLPIILVGSVLAGGLWAAFAAVMKTWRQVPEVISTIMLNFVAIYLLSYLVNGPMERPDHSQPATQLLPAKATLVLISQLLPNSAPPSPLHIGFIIALAMVVIVAVLLKRTPLGFAMKLVGANSTAARLTGISVSSTLIIAMLCSGGLCGLAGGVELCGRVGFIPEGYSPGYGYEAVAVALLGRLSPSGILLTSIFIGALSVGCQNMERTAGIHHEMGYIIQAVALLALLATQWHGWPSLFTRPKLGTAV